MRIRLTLDIERRRPPETEGEPYREVDIGSSAERAMQADFDDIGRIGFVRNPTTPPAS